MNNSCFFPSDDLLLMDDDDSGVSSARTNSSGKGFGGNGAGADTTAPGSDFSTPPPSGNLLNFDEPGSTKFNELENYMSFEERDAFKKIADEKLLGRITFRFFFKAFTKSDSGFFGHLKKSPQG